MSNINAIQGAVYGQQLADTGAVSHDTSPGGGFGLAMGQATAAGPVLTPAVAQGLMYRSMTTGVPTAELEQFGGYSAVKAMFDANGGTYSLDAISASQRQALAQEVAVTGVGNLSLLLSEQVALTPAATYAMKQNGIDLGSIDAAQHLAQGVPPQKSQGFADVSGTESVKLTPSIAKGLMYRSMTTGVPSSEMSQYGGYDAVKAMYDAGGGEYSLNAIPADQRRSLATVVAETGVGNMSAPVAEKIGLSSLSLKSMASNGIDKTAMDQIAQKTAAFEIPPFVDTQSYISTFMKNF